ncbi:MAG: L-threonylcarbamoyladenylate synthase [Cryomorphaceae bacterium]
MIDSSTNFTQVISQAAKVMRAGGVIAYPTEYCFGLGCDPRNEQAIARLLKIKNRQAEQGLILIAADIEQVCEYVDLASSPLREQIKRSWPGPNTWTLAALESVSQAVSGKHTTVAMRISGHSLSRQLCEAFGGAIVSTSANRHGQDALLQANEVAKEMSVELDYIIAAPVGGAPSASTIRDGLTGQVLR